MQLIDTHAHLQFDKLYDDIDSVLERARAGGLTRMITVGTSLADSQQAVEIAASHDEVWAAVGVHPHETNDFKNMPKMELLNKLSSSSKVVAVGEIGLDYYKDYAPREDQIKLLRAQLETTLQLGLPYIFHVRDAFKDFWPIFDEYKIQRGVIHSFSAGPKILDQVLSRNLYVGLNGIMTFTRDESQLAAAKAVPLNRLVLETDAPFLAPASHRGEVCEPKHVRDTAEFLADLRGESLEELAAASTANAIKLFGLK